MPRDTKVQDEIPRTAINRFPLYLRALLRLEEEGGEVVCSEELGRLVVATPAQIRKDLSYIGHLGVQGRGYDVSRLRRSLQETLGLDREWPIVVVGLEAAELRLLTLESDTAVRFRVSRAYDADPAAVGRRIGGVVVEDIASLTKGSFETPIEIAMISVKADDAQRVVNALVENGVRAILSVGPLAARLPSQVELHEVDTVLMLETMTYALTQRPSAVNVPDPSGAGASPD